MTRTGPQKIPGAVLDLFFGNGQYSGSDMEVNCVAVHTTEGSTLVDYNGGAVAPTVTGVPDFARQRLVWHQHFDVDESARALVHASGQPATNTANCFQIELVGTCDPAMHTKWAKSGVQHVFWPEPPDWAVRDLAWLARWLHDQHGVPLTARPEWLPYPASYGASRVRMSQAEWSRFTGWCGHQHVPQNDHGDPGNLPIARVLAAAGAATAAPTTNVQEDDMPLTDDEIRKVAAAVADATWNWQVPIPRLNPDGNGYHFEDGRQGAYWPLVWGNIWSAQAERRDTALQAAVASLAGLLAGQHDGLTAEQVQEAVETAIQNKLVHVQVDIAGAPATPTAPKGV
ncbi:hypothetical protein [Kitasatospora phosalacinea]|uniref:N-acetylmuramoyl-L-alanine amidase domain-containing protein n=1 Tax=Kitasatospora phosalacinea TaxID=2065 RepID=A0ABW6GRZ2_9ACTN